ncbi:hypothetical protein [Xenorhabdus hominickii]|uniref:Uncharacterized protein n=1 Tax=Xenorhabdus hominickii TaxID=351679 RepID=A0ABM6DPB3_XENHO|nr:hypothetical protein [Xenorhabdus hominickii]AOM39748.1 hypothetical protein A9255_03615 [Xenorhabdus hominickii]
MKLPKVCRANFNKLSETFGKKLPQRLEITEASFDALDKRLKATYDRLENVNSRLQYRFIAWFAVGVVAMVSTLFFRKIFVFILV